MKIFLITLGIVAIVLIVIVLGYGAAIALNDPLAGKENEAETINFALKNMGVDEPTWQTIVVAASAETDVSPDTVWAVWTKLEDWPQWSQPLHLSARWLGEAEWREGAEFEQVLTLGFPLGEITAQEKVTTIDPGERVMWCKDENGVKSCHIWRFEALPDGGTKITNVETFHGAAMGLVKPLVTGNVQSRFEASIAGLIQQASK